ncbi:MAG TPA: putative toxin-antitoxin system toxin component, PIN family [Verrucomicrobiae bacterium]|nr:putative toxin-antitoxin system toxin component, PIN family [Verrucomicrobiae bacterium]
MRTIFDTNVVVSASVWRGAPFECLAAWAQGRCEAIASPPLLAEYHETTEERRLDYLDRPFVNWAEALTSAATLVFPDERIATPTRDLDDEMVLECALASEADFIVSGDKSHLLPLKEFSGISIFNPIEFLRRLAA